MHDSDYGTQHGRQEITPARSVSCLGDVLLTLGMFTIILCFIMEGNSVVDYHPVIHQSMVEIKQLELAMELYKSEFDEVPLHLSDPREIVQHLNRVVGNVQVQPSDFQHDLETLDEREALCFWLDGQMMKEVCRRDGEMFFDFDSSRLSDTDRDGWLEFHDRKGACFILRGGKILLSDSVTQSTLSGDQLSEGQRFE